MENNLYDGIILKGIGGFYYVETENGTVECKARGVFRKDDLKPVAGDRVKISTDDGEKGTIEEILPRKNSLVRPPSANIDTLFFIVSTVKPAPNTLVLDKLIAIAEHKGINQAIVITKTDLSEFRDIYDIYTKAGFKVLVADYTKPDEDSDIAEIKALCAKGVSVFCGNSGVGKSTLLNAIDKNLNLKTGDISDKLGRGRHTTRSVELYKLSGGGYIADSPGFSALEMNRMEIILKDDLQYCFKEFAPYIDKCRFKDCSHTSERDCAVINAVKQGEIPESRHKSYIAMYDEAKKIKEWELP